MSGLGGVPDFCGAIPARTVRNACLILALCACWLPAPGRAQSSTAELFARGNRALLRDRPAEAAAAYQALAGTGIADPDLEYNRGLAYAQLDQLGRALLHLERARQLRPGDGVQQAIAQVQEALGQRLAEREGEATLQTRPPLLQALVGPLSADTFAVLLWLSVALASGSWIALQRAVREGARLAAGVTGAVALLIACLSLGGLTVRAGWLREGEPALVIAEEATLHQGPDSGAPPVASLHEGARGSVLERQNGFARWRGKGLEGWVPESRVGTY